MDFQLSVFYQGHYLSYTVSSSPEQVYSFLLKSAPADSTYHPENFTISKKGRNWQPSIQLDDEFKKDLLQQLKKQLV